MQTGIGQVVETILEDGVQLTRISCRSSLTPIPGQYLLGSLGSDSPLPVPVFYTDSAPDGFIAAPQAPDSWRPGHMLHLRGPLGRGFDLPASARRVALLACNGSPVRLHGLIQPALRQEAAVVLVCDFAPERLPDAVEVQPLSAVEEVIQWADTITMDVRREDLPQWQERLRSLNQVAALRAAQALILTQMPCGGIAECGVCAVSLKSGWRLACKEGPVLDWRELG